MSKSVYTAAEVQELERELERKITTLRLKLSGALLALEDIEDSAEAYLGQYQNARVQTLRYKATEAIRALKTDK